MLDRKHSIKKVLVTGGAGFIGCNFVRYLLEEVKDVQLVVLDNLTYAGSLLNLSDVEQNHGKRYRFVNGDICDEALVKRLFVEEQFDTVVHLAAESHVDRSIDGPAEFLRTNIMGTYVLLQQSLAAWQGRDDVRFHHVSTDEVFGSLGQDGYFTEATPYDPSSPYSASKASSDHLVRAWYRTFGLPVTITNCSNNYGPYQFPEKLIPLMISRGLVEKTLPVYGDGKNVRDWLHVEDHCRAIYQVITFAESGRTYNIGGHNEWANIDIVHLICDLLDEFRPRQNKSYRELISFVEDRPGHDRRYAIDAKLVENELGWVPKYVFEKGLRQTIQWYLENEKWAEAIREERYSGERLGLTKSSS